MVITPIAVIAFVAILFIVFVPAKKSNKTAAKSRSEQRRRVAHNHSGDFQNTVMVER